MYGFVKKGLLLTLASSALVFGGAGFASADSASTTGSTTGNEGAVTGNVVGVPADVPINVCGDTVNGIAAADSSKGNTCTDTATSAATAMGTSKHTEGFIAGNVVQGAINAPIQACGLTADVVAADNPADGNTCTSGASASATGSTDDADGAVSGNVIQLAVNAPISACGDSVNVIGFANKAMGNTCTN